MGNGMRGMHGTRGMFTMIPGNVLILVFRGMFKKIPGNAINVLGNVWKDSGECSGKLQGMLSILKLTKTTFYLEKVHVK